MYIAPSFKTDAHSIKGVTNYMIIPQITISLSFDKTVKKSELITVSSSYDISEVLKEVFNKDTFDWTEEMILLCLNRMNAVVGYYKVSSGGVSGVICDPKVVFTIALQCGASSIVIAHNHPSGNLAPSKADEEVTRKIVAGGKLLDIRVLDHIILTTDGYYSFLDNGTL